MKWYGVKHQDIELSCSTNFATSRERSKERDSLVDEVNEYEKTPSVLTSLVTKQFYFFTEM